jgi:uncharacterized RDD family membrane protein YckC
MTLPDLCGVAGFTFLFYIAAGIGSMVLFNRATSGEGIAAKLAGIARHATDVRNVVVLALLQCFSALVLAVTLYAITREQDSDLAMLACLGYFFFQEALWGATLGKRAFGLRVVRLDGRPAGWSASFWRTILRILEVNPALLGAIPEGLAVTWSKRKQRLGDMLAHRVMVRRDELVAGGQARA